MLLINYHFLSAPSLKMRAEEQVKKILKERLYVSLNPLLGEKVRLYAVA